MWKMLMALCNFEYYCIWLVHYVILVTGFTRQQHCYVCLVERIKFVMSRGYSFTSSLVAFVVNPLYRRCLVGLVSIVAVWPHWK
jgi:hypothetical protein